MPRLGTWYRRRLPWVGMPPAPSLVARAALVVVSSTACSVARRGLVLVGRVPAPKRTPPRPAPPLVVSSGSSRRGLVVWARPPLKPPAANVAGPVRAAQVRRYEPPLAVRQGRVWQTWLPYAVPGPAGPVVRRLLLRARPDNRVVLAVGLATRIGLGASVKTSYSVGGSAVMSISAKLTFFQGEDVTLTFTLTPPQDITGWTLTGTVKNQLGGTTQLTFTPTILDAGRGVFQASWARAQTTGLTPGDYVWDVRRTDTGNNTVLAHGEATVKQPVTA